MSQGFLIFAGGVRLLYLAHGFSYFKEDVMEIQVRNGEGSVRFAFPEGCRIRHEQYSNDGVLSRFLTYLCCPGMKKLALGELRRTFLFEDHAKASRQETFIPHTCFKASGDNCFTKKKGKIKLVFQ